MSDYVRGPGCLFPKRRDHFVILFGRPRPPMPNLSHFRWSFLRKVENRTYLKPHKSWWIPNKWLYSRKLEHTKSTPYRFSLPLSLSVTSTLVSDPRWTPLSVEMSKTPTFLGLPTPTTPLGPAEAPIDSRMSYVAQGRWIHCRTFCNGCQCCWHLPGSHWSGPRNAVYPVMKIYQICTWMCISDRIHGLQIFILTYVSHIYCIYV